jgi:asparagine N-glycosylation enzyme membrane subunit Stt3
MVASIVGPAAAPLGYEMGTVAGSMVPVYPPGLPLLMAIAIRVGGPSSAYLVVPLCGGLAVWLTYLLGARIADARAGVVAAVLVAFDLHVSVARR